MSGVYGKSFFKKGSPGAKKFRARLRTLESLATRQLSEILERFPNLKDKLFVSTPNIRVALGRYFNDVERIKKLHSVETVNRPKIAAHTVKWLSVYPALVSPIESDSYACLSHKEQKVLLEANMLFIFMMINYFIGLESNPNLTDRHKTEILTNVRYLLSTHQYCERAFSLPPARRHREATGVSRTRTTCRWPACVTVP